MPIYEYQCQNCEKNFDVFKKISDSSEEKCPECGKKMKKLVSAAGFQLKGTGWYKTDYASKKTESKDTSKKTETKDAPKKEEKKAAEPAKKDSKTTEKSV